MTLPRQQDHDGPQTSGLTSRQMVVHQWQPMVVLVMEYWWPIVGSQQIMLSNHWWLPTSNLVAHWWPTYDTWSFWVAHQRLIFSFNSISNGPMVAQQWTVVIIEIYAHLVAQQWQDQLNDGGPLVAHSQHPIFVLLVHRWPTLAEVTVVGHKWPTVGYKLSSTSGPWWANEINGPLMADQLHPISPLLTCLQPITNWRFNNNKKSVQNNIVYYFDNTVYIHFCILFYSLLSKFFYHSIP